MLVYMPAFYLGVNEELQKVARCWAGYEPVPGKKPYSEDSCRPKGSKKKEPEKKAEAPLQTSVPGETPEQLLSRVRSGKANFPRFIENAQQHAWSVPGVPFANTLIHKFINSNLNNPEAIKQKVLSQPDDKLIKIIDKNPEAFRGVQNNIPQPAQQTKVAIDMDGMPVNENIIPSLSGQAKWKYVRTKDGLKLSDGNLVYSFGGFPEDYPAEDTRVSRGEDDNILNFEKDMLSKGTAQIHRASPDNIYMTLANGADNPTFMLQHEEGKNWRYSPSKKFIEKLQKIKASLPQQASRENEEKAVHSDSTLLDPEAFMEGMKDHVKEAGAENLHEYMHPFSDAMGKLTSRSQDALALVNPYHGHGMMDAEGLSDLIQKGVQGAKNQARNFVEMNAAAPVTSMLKGYAISKGVDSIRDYLNPERAEERKKDPKARMMHELSPIAWGAVPALASMAIMAK